MTAIEFTKAIMMNANPFYRDLFGKLFAALYECKRTADDSAWKREARKVKKLLKSGRTTDQIISAVYAFQSYIRPGTKHEIVTRLNRYRDVFIDAIRAMHEGSLEEIKIITTSHDLKQWKPF
jgi:hypothetical protein